jgi:hypothetical protein
MTASMPAAVTSPMPGDGQQVAHSRVVDHHTLDRPVHGPDLLGQHGVWDPDLGQVGDGQELARVAASMSSILRLASAMARSGAGWTRRPGAHADPAAPRAPRCWWPPPGRRHRLDPGSPRNPGTGRPGGPSASAVPCPSRPPRHGRSPVPRRAPRIASRASFLDQPFGHRWATRHLRMRARSTTGQVAGAATWTQTSIGFTARP